LSKSRSGHDEAAAAAALLSHGPDNEMTYYFGRAAISGVAVVVAVVVAVAIAAR